MRKPPDMAASVTGKLVPRIIEMRILKLVGYLLTFFRNKITVEEKAFISALRNPFSSIVTHPFFVN